ncbi:hypothetical protein [Flaviaesturariibacter amylovorans]|uniref:Uncharacterized protein n=1 Tax=Flaviaesturariibacter amylovorans TaxID=1084520 RepID=A0ABP8GXW5_9BACT
MKPVTGSVIVTFLLMLVACPGYGQAPAEEEKRLVALHREMTEAGRRGGDATATGKAFRALLRQVAASGWSLDYPFSELRSEPGVQVVTSPDGRLRLYSWDDETGGTMRYFCNLFQYRDHRGKVIVREALENEPKAGYLYSALFQLKGGAEPLYLARRHGTYSSKDAYEGVQALCITVKGLDGKVKAIRTNTGLRNGIGFSYNFFSVVDRSERPVTLIGWDPKSMELTLPVVRGNGAVTNGKIRYRFDGRVLVRLDK